MALGSMAKDKIKILKADGQEIDGLKASVQSGGIYLMRSDILVEPSDLIQRVMSNGGVETFRVIDPGFHEGISHIPSHYQMKVQKLGLPEAEKAIQSITYNISGANARVNNNSVDNSTNVANINSDVAEHISMLRSEIERLVKIADEKNEALELVGAIEEQFHSSSPSKPVLKTLISALPSAGSIASIGSFLLSVM
ncbi:hypothetical protein IMCC1989_2465 [gamma proteobacterium IMCC1989]|nr:hypothetical protein IMCC1989_2465 [gamma proteobacterium IMCC1989]